MAVLTTPHARLAYEAAGAGAPPLVFVHGFACARDDWRHQLPHFARRHRVAALDLRGHGESTAEAEACTLRGCAEDVCALLDALDLPPAVLIGHSMGCRVVLEAYTQAPGRIAALVLLDGSALASGNADAEAEMRARIEAAGYPEFARSLYSEAMLPASDLGAAIMSRAVALAPAVGTRLFSSMIGWDASSMRAALARVAVPLLAIQSTYLNTARKRVGLGRGGSSPWLDLVKEMVPSAVIEIVPGPGHFLQLEAPEAVNRAIESFLAARLHTGSEPPQRSS